MTKLLSFFLAAFLFSSLVYSQETEYFHILDFPWTNVTNGDYVWFFTVDPSSLDNATSPCPVNSSVCFCDQDGKCLDAGLTDTAEVYPSAEGIESGINIVYESDTACPTMDGTLSTTLFFVCPTPNENDDDDAQENDDDDDNNDQNRWADAQIVYESAGCFTNISIISESACPTHDGGMYLVIHPFIFIAFWVICISLCCCCCRAIIRRRRCAANRKALDRQFSNFAFQPIPQSVQETPVAQNVSSQASNIPAYNPYVFQPQMMPFYFASQQPQQYEMKPMTQQERDEELAKTLQAQYDSEA